MSTPLTEIKGVGPTTERLLKKHSIQSVEDLVAAAIEDISIIKNFGEVRARRLQQAARDMLASYQVTVPLLNDVGSVPIREPVPIVEPLALPILNHAPLIVADLDTASSQKAAESAALVVVTAAETALQQAEELTLPPQITTSVPAEEEPEPVAARGRTRRHRRGPQVNNGNISGGVLKTNTPKRQVVTNPRPERSPQAMLEAESRTRSVATPMPKDTSMLTQAQMGTCTMALFCDFENIALGARDAHYAAFDIQKVLERLLLKGNIVVRKAYCDWERYKEFKAPMHEAAFELIEIPHLRQSGKNSADIRMVVDALDLCYTKQHLDTFVIISGDSDFTSLVTKLRENNKTVIGIGVKKSTSDLFTSNCDEFIFYDDLLRESEKEKQRRGQHDKNSATIKPTPKTSQSQEEVKMQEALDIVLETVEDLFEERGGDEKVWGSMVKQAVKRRKPGFNERYHGFRTFSKLLEEASSRGLLRIQHDEKSGGYIIEGFNQED